MDEPTTPTSGGFTPPAAPACSWRLTEDARARAPTLEPGADPRSAAFVTHVAGALERTQRRWF
jgi:hypothetical protein